MAVQTGVRKYLRGLFGVHEDISDTVDTDIGKMFQPPVSIPIVANANAATATALTYIGRVPANAKVNAVYWVGDTAITSDNSNYCTFQLLSGNGTAAAATVVGQANLSPDTVSNVAAATPYEFTLTAANASLTAGHTLAVQVTKTGTGAAIGTGSFWIDWEYV